MEFDTTTICFILLIIVAVYLLTGCVMEGFQRMNYIQLHNFLDQSYNYPYYGYVQSSPYRKHKGDDYNKPTTSITGRRGYSDLFPVLNTYDGYGGYNVDRLIGYLYSQDEDDNEVYELYEVYDYRRGRPGYAYKNTKDSYFRDSILVKIDPKKYNGDYLDDGEVVNITYANKPFVVKLYKIKRTGLGTRYRSRDYRSGMHEYALLEPVNPPTDIAEEDKYYVMYEQEIDPRREQYNYYIKDKRGIIIELTKRPTKYYDGDTITIPGKEQYGEYRVQELDRY